MSSLLQRVIVAHRCRSTHHFIVMSALDRLSGPEATNWRDVMLVHHLELLRGAKAPDAEFKDFKNHVLHISEGEWGGARDAANEWYGKAVEALRKKSWAKAAYALGVMSHYYADPLQPFHTGQTEEEGAIHRAVEWSIAKSRAEIEVRVEKMGYPELTVGEGPGFVSDMVRAGAEASHPHYHTLLDHYNVDLGVKNPPAGLDETLLDVIAGLVAHATQGVAVLFDRAFAEASVEPKKVHLTLRGYLSTLDIPIQKVMKKMDDRESRKTVEKMYKELQATGKVVKSLPKDDKAIRKLHAKQVLRVPLKELNAKEAAETGTKHVERVVPDMTPAKVKVAKPAKTKVEKPKKVKVEKPKKVKAEKPVKAPKSVKAPKPKREKVKAKGKETPILEAAPESVEEAVMTPPAAKVEAPQERPKLKVKAAPAALAPDPAPEPVITPEPEIVPEVTAEPVNEVEHVPAVATETAEPVEADYLEGIEDESEHIENEEVYASTDDLEGDVDIEDLEDFEALEALGREMEAEAARKTALAAEDEADDGEDDGEAVTSEHGLDLDSPVVDAPSIGRKTAKRLKRVGITTIADLLEANADEVAEEMGMAYITPEVFQDWQDQTWLMLDVPGLRVHDAQILVGSGVRSSIDLADASVHDLLASAMNFFTDPSNERMISRSSKPDEEEVISWIELAQSARG